ncbi:MAG TPA: hypothetical protein PLU72_09705 [Candidatus Ozemobacteraceae bacterium]|nr:hypothetical protein [Candidatus Ozemobacteraceae bacterium]
MRFLSSRPSFPAWAQCLLLLVLFITCIELWVPWFLQFFPPPGVLKTIVSDGQEREYYLFVPEELPASQAVPLLFMLQGFDAPDAPSGATRSLYRQIADAARLHRFIAVFPRGMTGSYPDVPGVRAWCPEHFHENRAFLVRLVSELRRSYPVDEGRIILAGFSNGAYFASTELTVRTDTPFTGFWLDGGGYPYGFRPDVKRRPVFLTWGERDIYNASYTRELEAFLVDHGWKRGETLLTVPHPWAHVFNNAAVGNAIAFLLGTR